MTRITLHVTTRQVRRLRVLRIFFIKEKKAFEKIGPAGVSAAAEDVGHPKNSAFAHKPGKDEVADVRQELEEHAKYFMYEAEIQKEPGSSNPNLARPDPFESYLLLRDFFQHCERTGVLAASEQQVLTRLKLEGLSAKQLAKLEGSTSEEAVHHRSYRIMARLRKAASRLRSHAHR